MKKVWGLFGVSLLLFSVTLPAHADRSLPSRINVHPTTSGPKSRIYIEAGAVDEARILEFRRALMERGAENVNLFLPSLIVCDVPVGVDMGYLIDDPAFTFIEESRLGANAVAAASEQVQFARGCYEAAHRLASGEVPAPDPEEFLDAVFTVPPEIVEKSRQKSRDMESAAALTDHRTIQQNTEFMIGDQLVQLVLPESEGSAENWTDEELIAAKQGAVSGMLAFQERFNYVPMNFVFKVDERVPTRYEPIHHNSETDGEWIVDVMKSLGLDAREAQIAVHEYNNAGRKRFGTDWAYTAFIADSRNEPGNRFRGAAYTAYAFLGGPYLVQPFPAGGDPNDLGEMLVFSQIFQHETIHIYWGLDEYPSAPTQCSSHIGYLDYSNMNKQSLSPDGVLAGCPNYVPCVMWGARNDEGRPVCFFTAGQIGVIDTRPENGIPDVFDMPPTVEFENSAVETVQTLEITLNFTAISRAIPNSNPAQDPSERINYAPPLKDATLNVNGVGAIRLTPLDGKWNGVKEDLSFKLSGLAPGLTEVVVDVRNTFGRGGSPAVKQIYFIGIEYALFDFNVGLTETGDTGVYMSWSTIGHTFDAELDVYRIHVSSVQPDSALLVTFVETPDPDELFHRYEYVDRNVTPGQQYRYYVVARFSLETNGEVVDWVAKSNTFTVGVTLPTVPGEIVSLVSPNPFNESTTLSINIPVSGDVTTEVDVTIYDVLGRRVKDIFRGSLFSRVELFHWDGTNSKNERVPSGIYFIRASVGPITEVKKVVVVR